MEHSISSHPHGSEQRGDCALCWIHCPVFGWKMWLFEDSGFQKTSASAELAVLAHPVALCMISKQSSHQVEANQMAQGAMASPDGFGVLLSAMGQTLYLGVLWVAMGLRVPNWCIPAVSDTPAVLSLRVLSTICRLGSPLSFPES